MRSANAHRLSRLTALVAVVSLLVSCGGGGDDGDVGGTEDEPTAVSSPTSEDGTATSAAGDLAAVCPDPVVFQLDWEPEAEHGMIYEMVGDDYTVDTEAKTVTGPLVSSGEPTGIDIEVRAGGAPVGYQSAESLLYQDQDIMFGFGRVAAMAATRKDLPVTGVYATTNKSPYAVYWDPETYPDAETIADLKDDNVPILYGSGHDVSLAYLESEGIVNPEQVDTSEYSKPGKFIAENGNVAESGFATAEPYLYEFEVADQWGRPVRVQLIHDTGYREYFQTVVVRDEDLEARRDCLEQLVPMMQQAQVDYVEDPDETHDLVIDLVEQYNTSWVYSMGQAEFAHQQMLELGILGNGDDGTVGDFEMDRVEGLYEIVDEVTDTDVSSFAPEDLVTNEFIDESIGLPESGETEAG